MWLTSFLFCACLGASMAHSILNEQSKKVCENDHCKAVAEMIGKAMKKTVEPCEDFYGYVCGNWEVNYPLPKDEEVWNLDKMTEHEAKLEVKAILEEEEQSDDFVPLKYEKWWYRACMDTEKIEETGIKPIEEILDYFGGWPITMNNSDWTDDNHDWQSVHEFYATFKDLSAFFNIRVWPDERNSSRHVIEINKPGKTLYEEQLEDLGDESSFLQKYHDFMKNVAFYFIQAKNATRTDEEVAKDVEEIIKFVRNLHMIKVFANETEDLEPSRAYVAIDDLQKYYDEAGPQKPTAKINWLHTISVMFKNTENVTIDITEEVAIQDKHYLIRLMHLLDETPNHVIVDYMHWKFISSSLKYLNKELRDMLVELKKKDNEPEVTPERWELCKADMKVGLGHKYEYVRRHFSEDTKKITYDIINEMRSEMLDEVDHSRWLDDATKEETLAKLHELKWQIGNANMLARRDFFEHLYNGIPVTSNYFDNVQYAKEFMVQNNLKRLRQRRSSHRYVSVNPLIPRAMYDNSQNIMAFSAAQLAEPLIHSNLPLSVNYGYMAPTMGHLMAHTLEKEVNTDTYIAPWSNYMGETYKSYEPKTECLKRQYHNYSVGPSTIDENMYDAIGLKVAYSAFENSFISENIEKLPGLEDLTDDQLFFVSYAMQYCQVASEKYLAKRDPAFETPNDYKVIGTLSNSEAFAKAFSCSANSPMNPEEKCLI